MAYKESGYRIMDMILMIIIGLFFVLIGLALVNGIQKIYNSNTPESLRLVAGTFSGEKITTLKYKDMLSFFSSTAFKIAKWIVKGIKFITSLI